MRAEALQCVAACWIAVSAALGCGQPENHLAGQMDLARLVDLAAQRLRLNIEYDAAVIKGTATLRLDAGLRDEELWLLLNRVLISRGFTTVRMPGEAAYSVVRLADAHGAAHLVIDAGQAMGPPAGYQTVVIRTRHRPARELIEPLSKVLSKPAGSAVALSDSLVLIGEVSHRMQPALDLLALLDQPTTSVIVEDVPLTNLSGVQMAALVMQVLAKRELASGRKISGDVIPGPDARTVILVAPPSEAPMLRALVEDLDQRDRIETISYAPAHFPARDVAALIEQTIRPAADDRWRLVIDDLTGSLVLTATPVIHEAARDLIDRLDAAPALARRPVRSFVIRNRSVVEVQGIIERLMMAGVIEASADPRSASAQPTREPEVVPMPPPLPGMQPAPAQQSSARTQPSPRQPTTASDSPLVLTSDEGTNTLIAIGEPRLLAQIESLLRTLDVRQPQVMLDVLMITLTESQAMDLGVELERLTNSGDAQIRLSSLFGLGVRTGGGDLTAPSLGAGFTGVVLSPGEFSIIVRALQTISHGRSLSMPRLLAGNNQQASLDAVVQQPFASVNASNTVSTTSFGGTQDAGTVVAITPQIAEGDHLLLEYSVSLSTFLGAAASATLPPPRQQNRVQSTATIPDGHVVVVGGIEIEDHSRGVSRLPLLGQIPVIGEAFKSRRTASSRSRFFVFIRATIMRHPGFEDLKYVSAPDVSEAGLDDGWPTTQPRIIR